MRTTFRFSRNLALLCLALSASAATPKAIDRGPLRELAGTTTISVTIALALPAPNDAEKLQQALYTPGAAEFHQFLTADQFVARFAPSDADVAKVIAALGKYRLAAERTTAMTLKVTGMPADMERAFSVSLHSYEVAPHDNVLSRSDESPHHAGRSFGACRGHSGSRQPAGCSSVLSDRSPSVTRCASERLIDNGGQSIRIVDRDGLCQRLRRGTPL